MALTRITQGVIKPNENYDTHNINSTGIVTATGLNISGNASIGGVLTYEDVTNIDSIGIITARSDIKVGTGVTLTSAGAGFYAGIVTASSFKLPDGSNVGGVESDSDQNTVGGTGAGQNLTGSSDHNTLFGYEAGNDIVSGDYNTLIGHRAGEYLYAGDQNTAVGKNALAFEYNGDYNVAIGYNSLLSARATNHNTVLGRKSGVFLSSGDENILLGSGAGGSTTSSESLTSGSNNIIIGFEALPSATTVSNEITLGNANNNHLRIPGIGVTFATSGNHINGVLSVSGITTFSDTVRIGGDVSLPLKVTTSGVAMRYVNHTSSRYVDLSPDYYRSGSNTGDAGIFVSSGRGFRFYYDGDIQFRKESDDTVKLTINKLGDINAGVITATGSVTDSKGDLRRIPVDTYNSSHTLGVQNAGETVYISSGGVTIPSGTFTAGDAITIINNSGSDQTITCSAVTTYLAGDTSSKSSLTLKGRGMATFYFASSSEVYGSGAGLE